MFGDSPWDYMSDEEREAQRKEWAAKDKRDRAKHTKRRLIMLRTYKTVELEAELRRRKKNDS